MEYGCIGEVLGHSFSKEIHNALASYNYELCEVARDRLEEFCTKKNFKAINVTIPYKEEVIPYLYEIDEHARLIGAVNTVVNRDGRLYGYNTDFYGMSRLLEHVGIDPKGKKAVILGSGGTSKTAYAVLTALGAREILRVSRTKREDAIDYEELYERHTDAEIVINTTPVGMYPRGDALSLDISRFPGLTGVIDAIYNPLRTRLILDAKERGIAAEGGLYMLVAQAVRASEIFLDTVYPDDACDRIYEKILRDKENIVLVGMPSSGKSTVGATLAALLGRELLDTDALIVEDDGRCIPEIFATDGEAAFRNLESRIVNNCSQKSSIILATGGGVVLKEDNVRALRRNGRIYFIDRPLSLLIPTSDRPLSSTVEAVTERYKERYPIYLERSDLRVDGAGTPEDVAQRIKEDFIK
ncbi:MAG: shikimate dehydrogenase [Clostridia bacterium]|nr:shikimate dehydrogenase [Clostridia bacterium]